MILDSGNKSHYNYAIKIDNKYHYVKEVEFEGSIVKFSDKGIEYTVDLTETNISIEKIGKDDQ